ncbi:MAG: Ig-like domain repeat protein [Acidobacteriaceae bacterium]|nr:Ig-like domain repeat protein [Acidobacteriaceae bacterium]
MLIDTGYPVLLGGIGVSPGTAIPYGTAFTFAAFAESTIPGEYAGWFTCGTNFASECYPGIGWEIPSGAPAWTIDGVSVGEGDMYFEYDSYECATDDNDEPMYCDAVTENLTYSAALSPGTHTVTVQWAQTSDPDSNSVVQSTTVTVTKANPSVLLSANPANMNYGSLATFTAAINGGANPTGTVTFEINGATFGTATVNNGVAIYNGTNESWPIGTYTISAVYSGDGSNNGAAGTVSETVSKAAPTITWSTPAAIFYGTALSASQLNATSSVPGTFVYSPATGTVLTAGTQILSVTFIPTDTTDYNTATGTVTLTMNKAALTVTPNPDSKTYGTANPMFTGTVTGLFVGDPITVAYSSGATAFTPAGIYSAGANAIAATLSDPTGRLGNYTLMQSLGTLTITQSGTAISITSSQNPSTYGDNVTFTFDFSGTGVPPTGTATLTEGATVLATLTLNSSGVATYTSSTLSAGTHTLKSTYNGDSNYY